MIGILSFVLVIGLGLLVHEFGHFLAAKKNGVSVPEFSIGMGPKLWKFTKGETDYVLRLLPVGGYVAMASVMEGEPHDGCFERKSKRARVAILVSGAAMNFLLAFIFVFAIGLFQGRPFATNELAAIIPDGAAAAAGLEVGDQIISFGGVVIANGEELVHAIQQTPGTSRIEFVRGGELHESVMTPIPAADNGQLVAGLQVVNTYEFSLLYAFESGIQRFGNIFTSLIDSLGGLLTGQIGASELSGPLGIYQMAAVVAQRGIYPLLLLAALINVNLGLFNLFPLPALDGGRLVFIGLEGLFKKAVPSKLESRIHMVGFFLFMGLFVFTFLNDLTRLRG